MPACQEDCTTFTVKISRTITPAWQAKICWPVTRCHSCSHSCVSHKYVLRWTRRALHPTFLFCAPFWMSSQTASPRKPSALPVCAAWVGNFRWNRQNKFFREKRRKFANEKHRCASRLWQKEEPYSRRVVRQLLSVHVCREEKIQSNICDSKDKIQVRSRSRFIKLYFGLQNVLHSQFSFLWSETLFSSPSSRLLSFAIGVQPIERIWALQHEITTANSGNSVLMVQSVSGGCKLDLKFAVSSNTSQARVR